jgi:hypothetical protein
VNIDFRETADGARGTIGVNYPYPSTAALAANRAFLAYPQFGIVSMTPFTGRSAYHSLQTAFTKRMSNRVQASATYSLSGLWSAEGQPLQGVPGAEPAEVPFAVAEDLGGPLGWTYGVSDQRHRAVGSLIYQVGHGFQVSTIHYTGAGNRSGATAGTDRRGLGLGGESRLRADGTLVPKNGFIQPPQHRTDVRLQQRIPLPNHLSVDLMAEAFNVFNRKNYTLGTNEANSQYGKPTSGQFRTMQFGFRMAF